MKKFHRAFRIGTACSLVLGTLAGLSAPRAFSSVVNLGEASGFAVLATNGNVDASDSTLQGNIGVAAGGYQYSEWGSQQGSVTAYINTGSKASGPSPVSINQSASINGMLSQAVNDAASASNTLAGFAPSQSLGNVNGSLSISEKSVGTYVLNISNINLSSGALTLAAPAGSTFVINVSGSISINGSSAGLLCAGGISSSNVIYNLCGNNSQVNTGSGSCKIEGSIFDCNGTVNLHPCEVDGQVICKSFGCYSGSICKPPPLTPVPEANAGWILGGLFPLMLLLTPARLRKAVGALRSRRGLAMG